MDTVKKGVEDGLSEVKSQSGQNLADLGMKPMGKNQVPQGVNKTPVSTDRGKFNIC